MSAFPPIVTLVPHRPPQLLLDRVLDATPDRITTEGHIPADALPGHFPGRPIVPGAWLVEGLAQSLAALAALRGATGPAFLTGVEKARFRGFAEPPVTLRYDVEVVDERFGQTRAKGVVRVGDRVVCTCELQATRSAS